MTAENNQPKANSSTNQDDIQQKLLLIDQFQNEMDYLFYEWNSIHIVLESIRNAFTIKHVTPEYLDEVDKELSIAYDDLKSQVRQLERRLKKMSLQVNQQLIQSPEITTPSEEE